MKVLIVDDHAMFAESLARLLATQGGVEEVRVADSIGALLRPDSDLSCDVAVVDWHLGDGRGGEAIEVIRRRTPEAKVVVLTGAAEPAVLRGSLAAGCDAFVTKDRAAKELIAAIGAAVEGHRTLVGAPVDAAVLGMGVRDGDLSRRELDVVECIARGMSNAEIGDELFISVNTVRNHVQRISAKLGEHSRVGIAMTALRLGLVELPAAS